MTAPGAPSSSPPRLAARLIAVALPREEREVLLGDLEETYARRRRRDGALKALAWYWIQVAATPARVAYEGRIGFAPIAGRRSDRSFARAAESLHTSIRLGVRRGMQRPGPVLSAVTVLSLAVGGSTALVATLDSFSRWEPGLPAPEEISALFLGESGRMTARVPYDDARRLSDALPDLATTLVAHRHAVARTASGATTVLGATVTPSFFDVVDAPLALGRAPTADHEVVVSDRFRRRRLTSTADPLGTSLWINGDPYTIVGVAAPSFRGLSGQPSLWQPLAAVPAAERAGLRVALLACRCDHTDLDATAPRLAATLQESSAAGSIEVAWRPAAEVWIPSGESTGINRANLTIATLALLVLAAACANVANLLLADGLERHTEIAVRAAIGASRGQLLRQLVLESTALAVAVCAGSYLVAIGVLAAVPRWLPTPIPGYERRVELPLHLLAAGVGMALTVTLVATLMPAWRVASARSDKLQARSPGGRRGRILEVLGATQLAAAAALTLLALTLGGSMNEVHDRPLGYEEDRRYSFTVDASALPDDPATRADAFRRFLAELADHPSVAAAGAAGGVPGFLGPYAPVSGAQATDFVMAGTMGVGSGYLAAAGTRLLEGRALRPADAGGNVAVVSASLGQALWGSADAIGRTVRIGAEGEPLRIVGVIEDGTYAGLDILPVVFWPLPPPGGNRALIVVHARRGPTDLNEAIHAALRAAHPDMSMHSLAPVSEWFDRHWLLTRAVGAILRTLATLGLLIGGIGVYAGFATIVARRRRELGIRMSLGATPAELLRRVMVRAGYVLAWGYGAGALLAVAGSRLVQAYLFQASPWDPYALAGGLGITGLLAAAASATPALRAARTDPASSLRVR